MTSLLRRSFVKIASLGIGSVCLFPYELAASSSEVINFTASEEYPPLSYEAAGKSMGIIPDLINAVFEGISSYEQTVTPYPWRRAQKNVRIGQSDAFCTYPSQARQEYAAFTSVPLYTLDMGYLIFKKDNPKADAIRQVKSYEELSQFLFVSEKGIDWEDDNFPSSIKRIFLSHTKDVFASILHRNVGDFYVANIHQTRYMAKELGYINLLDFAKVDFITNSKVDFHIGISRTRNDAEEVANILSDHISSPSFAAAKEKVLNQY